MKELMLYMFLLVSVSSYAQPFTIDNIGINEGLSNNYVVSVVQDKKGFMWFATEEGLNRFDGVRFLNYYKKDSDFTSGITANELNCLLDDPVDSILWIGTQRAGLNAYDYANNNFTTYRHDEKDPHSIVTDDITKIVAASDGNIWICTYWGGIDYFDKATNSFNHYNYKTVPGFINDHIWTLAEGDGGTLYIGYANKGFSILSTKDRTVKNFTHDPHDATSLPSNEVTCIYNDNDGNIWVGTNVGLSLFDKATGSFFLCNNKVGKLSYRICDILQADEDKLWIAMEFGGIAVIDMTKPFTKSGLENVSCSFLTEGADTHSLSNSSIRCLFLDKYNNMWAGSWGGGINFIRHEPLLFNSYSYSAVLSDVYSLNSKIASSVCIDDSGQLWIGTDGGGINVFKNGKCVNIFDSSNSSIGGNTIQAALCDSRGNLWFGLFCGGIAYYNQQDRSFRKIFAKEQENTDVRSFYEDKDGNVWVGTSNGIYVVAISDLSIKKHFDKGNNLVRYVLKDSIGFVWSGFFGGGLSLYDSALNEIKAFNVTNGFPSNTINSIYEDSRKRLWVATGDGLVLFDSPPDTNYKVYQRRSGLANTHIYAVCEDSAGNIWASTNKGISCLPNGADAFYNYGHNDNLPSGSFNRSCVAYGNDGNLYFGSINGLCYFNPLSVLKKRKSPPAIITDIEIFEPIGNVADNRNTIRNIDGASNVKLTYKQNNFKISFSIQNYALIKQVEYAYMLEGLNDAWYTIADANDVIFRNLQPGNYMFKVKARLRNNEWTDEVSQLKVVIDPPVWLTWWAKLAYFTLVAAVVFLLLYIYKKRLDTESLYKLEKSSLEREQELNNERLHFYTNITHELRTPLTLVLGPLEDLRNENSLSPKDARKISVIHESAIRLLNLINQLLEFRKAETQKRRLCVCRDNISRLIYDIGLKYKEFNHNTMVEIRTQVEDGDIMMYFDREVLNIILDNLISNAMKYTEKGSITVGIGRKKHDGKEYADIWVSDTGHGIPADALPHIFDRYYQAGGEHQASGTGIGLSLVKSFASLHEGLINVDSVLDIGTTFRLSLLLNNTYPDALHKEAEEKDIAAFRSDADTEKVPNKDKPIVLVVEDDQEICKYISESLSEYFEVRTSTNGRQGKERALEIIPDIIVSDIMMPEMDGDEMCRELKQNVCTSHIPVILLTAKDSQQDKEDGYTVGADSYLTKPFSASLLRSRINNLLQSRSRLAKYFVEKFAIADKSNVMAESLNKIDDAFIQKINKLIEENLSSDKIDVNYLADSMCVSGSTLYRKMKALTGLSTNEYIRKIKMKNAERLLIEGRFSISEIAFKVGISNIFYFRQCFKKEFGLLPSEFLRKIKEEAAKKT